MAKFTSPLVEAQLAQGDAEILHRRLHRNADIIHRQLGQHRHLDAMSTLAGAGGLFGIDAEAGGIAQRLHVDQGHDFGQRAVDMGAELAHRAVDMQSGDQGMALASPPDCRPGRR